MVEPHLQVKDREVASRYLPNTHLIFLTLYFVLRLRLPLHSVDVDHLSKFFQAETGSIIRGVRVERVKHYAIGTPGIKWGTEEKAQWLMAQVVRRSYAGEVLERVSALRELFDVEQYGELEYQSGNYPLFAVKTRDWRSYNQTLLLTGGVHGYETSGVQGAIRFLETRAADYAKQVNFVVVPCVSPWGYETINRWNPNAVDPNRSFLGDSPAAEAATLIDYLSSLAVDVDAHIDLHETTDTDNSEFMPALAARDATEVKVWDIPDGFYLVGDSQNPVAEFQKAIIDAVEKLTHIAPADAEGKIIGLPTVQRGVINFQISALGLCAAMSGAKYCTTTEVYPDSPSVDDENCILAQVAAVTGALDFILAKQ
jgi:hypothetical protein